MSRFVTRVGDEFVEEIASMDECKHKINDVCSNEECDCLGSYTYRFNCGDKDICGCFEKEDGII